VVKPSLLLGRSWATGGVDWATGGVTVPPGSVDGATDKGYARINDGHYGRHRPFR